MAKMKPGPVRNAKVKGRQGIDVSDVTVVEILSGGGVSIKGVRPDGRMTPGTDVVKITLPDNHRTQRQARRPRRIDVSSGHRQRRIDNRTANAERSETARRHRSATLYQDSRPRHARAGVLPAPCAPGERRHLHSLEWRSRLGSCHAATIPPHRNRASQPTRWRASCEQLPASGCPPASWQSRSQLRARSGTASAVRPSSTSTRPRPARAGAKDV